MGVYDLNRLPEIWDEAGFDALLLSDSTISPELKAVIRAAQKRLQERGGLNRYCKLTPAPKHSLPWNLVAFLPPQQPLF